MKKNYLLFLFLLLCSALNLSAQVTISGGTTAAGSYTTLASAITALNGGGALTAPVTVDVVAGHTESLTAKIVLTMTGDATNTITIQKNGAGVNPKLISYTGTVATPSVLADGFFVLAGTDYVTIDGIDLEDKATNTTTTTVMEFGYGLFKASVTDGCQNNTIKNCKITLNRVQNTAWTAPGHNGSCGIAMVNGLHTATGALTITAASGSNSFNKFYSNTIQNCNAGIAFVGFVTTVGVGPNPDPFSFFGDLGNDIGGTSAATGNTILNFGGGAATNPATGIFANNQWSMNCSYNTINNNTGTGVNHTTTLRGIFFGLATSTSASLDCNNNNVTIFGGGTTSQVTGIESGFGATAAGNTININNNTIAASYLPATSGVFYGIWNNAATPATLNMNGNTITSMTYSAAALAGSGAVYPIYNTGAATTVNMNNNTVRNVTRTGTTGGTTIGIYTTVGTNQNVIKNTIKNISIDGTGAASILYGIQTATGTIVVDSNTVDSLRCIKTTGTSALYGIYDVASPTNENYNYNTISNIIHKGTGTVYGLFTNTAVGTRTVSNNTIFNIETAGLTVSGMLQTTSSPKIFNNKVYNVTSTSTGSPTVSGITINTLGASGVGLVYNNYIGKITAPNAVTATPATLPSVRGLNLATTTTAVNLNVYYNTILIDGTSSGATFGTTGIFHTEAAATLDLRNNIVANTSVPKGAGKATAFHRSAATSLASLAATSNHNLFYAGTPSVNNVIFYDGTNVDQTLAAYQVRVSPREDKSVTENVNFLNTTTPASANYLHINTTTPTFIEAGGIDIAGISVDFDGNSRQSPPDIGADEGTFTGLLAVAINTVSITPTGNLCTNAPRNISAVTTAGTAPITSVTLKYSVNGVAQTPIPMTGGTITGNSTWAATIPTVTPSDAAVTWTVEAVDVTATKNQVGTAYKDEPLTTLAPNATATPSVVCIGSNTNLALNIASTPGTIGVGATTSATYSNPFYSLYSNLHEQILIKGSELTAAGFFAGDITALGLDITVIGTLPMLDFSLKIGHTTANDMSVFVASPSQTVYTSASLMPVLGLNNMVFSTPFAWDGVSNVVLEFCHGNPSSTATMSRTALMDNVGFVSTIKTHNTTSTSGSVICGNTTSNVLTYSVRPKFTISGNKSPFTTIEWKNGSTVIGTTANLSIPVTANATYTVTASDLNGCSVTKTTSVTTIPLPASPTATSSTQCGSGIPTASLSSNAGANGTGKYNWYDAPTAGNLVQAPPFGALQNYYSNDFSSTVLTNSSVSGVATVTAGGELQLVPNTASQYGAFMVNAAGYNSTAYQIDFDATTLGTAGSTADGWSYSFGNDVSATATSPTAEQGTGSKLRVAFDSYGAMPNGKGIYLMYNMTATSFNATTAGVLAYSTVDTWINTTTHYTISINASGKLTLSVGGTPIFTDVQLPSSFLTDNKSNWAHVFKARTGSLSMLTSIDNLAIQNNQQTAGSTTYQSVLGVTTTFHVTEIGTNGCESTPTPITVTVNTPPVLTITPSQTVCNGEILKIDVTSPLTNYNSYTWGTGTNLYLDAAASTPYVVGTNTPTVYFQSATVGTNSVNVNASNSLCQEVASSNLIVLPNAISISADKKSFCVSADPTLTANINPLGAILQWQSSTNGGTTWTDIISANAQTYAVSTNVTTDFRLAVRKNTTTDCFYSNTLTISVFDPQLLSSTGATRCGTGTVSLSATPSVGAEIQWYSAATGGNPIGNGTTFTSPVISTSTDYYAAAINVGNNATVTQGAGATTSATYSNPFYSLWSNIHTQHLITAAELAASGMVAGDINSVGLDITAAGTLPMLDFSLKIGTTNVTNMSSFVNNAGFVTVHTRASLMPTTGVNVLTFSTPFYWDGISNIVLEFCHGNSGSTATMSRTAKADNTSYVSTIKTNNTVGTSGSSICGNTTSNVITYSLRPQFIFNAKGKVCESPRAVVSAIVNAPPAFAISPNKTICNNVIENLSVTSNLPDYDTYTWDPITDLYTDVAATNTYSSGTNANNVYLKSTTAKVHKVIGIASNATTGCQNRDTVDITVMPDPRIVSNIPSICVTGSANLTLSPAIGYGLGSFQWSESLDGITYNVIAGANAITYTTSVTSVTLYHKMELKDEAGVTCPSLITDTIEVFNPQLVSTSVGSRCGTGTVNLSATANPGNAINWYTAATGGTPIGTGVNFTTPVITTTTDFYVAANQGYSTADLGLPNRVGATSNSGYSDVGLMFDALQSFTLESVAVYPIATTPSGNVTATIALKNSAGTTLQSITVSLATSPLPGIKTLVPLNFTVPAGTGHRLVFTSATGGGITGFIREATTGYTYPYTLPGIASITSAYTSGASSAYYYYFYDWKVSSGCESPRTAVTATVTAPPAFAITTNKTICNNAIQAIDVITGAADYNNFTWELPTNLFTDAAATTPYFAGNSTLNVYLKSATAGVQKVIGIGENSTTGCSNRDTIDVNVLPVPTVKATPDAICVSGTSALSILPASGYTGATFQWSDSNDGVSYSPIATATTSTYNTPTLTTTKFYRLQLKDGSGTVCAEPFDTVVVSNPMIATTTPASRCGSGTVILEATPVTTGASVNWYSASTGGSSLGTGNTFTTPVIGVTTTFFAAAGAGAGVGSVGASSTSIGTISASTIAIGTQSMSFNVKVPTTIISMDIYPTATIGSNGTIQIQNSAGTIIANVPYTTTVTGGLLQTVTLNVSLPIGNAYKIGQGTAISLNRNTTGASYPYTSAALDIVSNTFDPGYFYFFYNWKVTTGCEGTRVPVVATVNSCPTVNAKVFLSHADPVTGLMDDYIKTLANFPTSDPYDSVGAFNGNYAHVNSGPTATVTPTVLATTGNNAIVDWVFVELRQGASGATTVTATKAGLLQKDGDIVGMDGFSPLQFNAIAGNYYIAIRHRNHTGFRTNAALALSNTATTLNFTNNSVTLYGAYPLVAASATVSVMNAGDSNSDGSIDAFDTIVWEIQNGLFDDYTNNSDYNMDGSVDAFDTILWN